MINSRLEGQHAVTVGKLVLILLTIALFWRVNQHEFINYDDPDYVTNNSYVQRGLTKESIHWAFTKLHGENTYWHPITWLSHMLDCQLFGLSAQAHHLVNLFFHTANVVLLFSFLNLATRSAWRSLIVAALFAIHPIQVDTVAWIAERKNVLSTLFLLLTLICYVRYARERSIVFYVAAVAAYATGLMSKPMLVTIPAILLLLDFWPLRRFPKGSSDGDANKSDSVSRLLVEKLPFAALAGTVAMITIRAHQELGMISLQRLPLAFRLENAAVSYMRYVGKLFLPRGLAVFYPHPGSWSAGWVLSATSLLIFLVALAIFGWKRRPYLTFGVVWFLATLLPVIGIIQAGLQAMADRFAYVPMIGLMIALVWITAETLRVTKIQWILVVGTLGCLALLTTRQLNFWENSETLWRHALAVTSRNAIAHYGLGYVLIGKEQYDGALRETEKALQISPDLVLSHYQVAVIKDRQGKYVEAITEYEKALEMRWNWAEAHRALLDAYYHAGKTNDAVAHLKRLVQDAPDNPGGHLELARALGSENRLVEAVEEYRQVTRLAPRWAIPRNDLAWLLLTHPDFKQGKEAVELAEQACVLTSWQHPIMVGTLAAAYAEAGEFDKATNAAIKAISLAESLGQREIAERNQKLLRLYLEKKTFRDDSVLP
jgi:tetratricopeptide (TPR) repeat protein